MKRMPLSDQSWFGHPCALLSAPLQERLLQSSTTPALENHSLLTNCIRSIADAGKLCSSDSTYREVCEVRHFLVQAGPLFGMVVNRGHRKPFFDP